MAMTEQAKRERELIAKVQKNNDVFAMKELLSLYRNVIWTCVKKANLSSTMSDSDAISYAENQFKRIIKENYDLSQNIQPNTFVMNILPKKLKTLRYNAINPTARMSSDLAMKAGYVRYALPMLKRRGIEEPTPKQVVDFVKNDMGKAPRFTQKEAARILALTRTELSADANVSRDTGDMSMTLGDTLNVPRVSAKELLEEKYLKDKVERIIAGPNFNRNERILVRRMYRIGAYKNVDPKNIHQAALNSGMADVTARRALEKVRKELERS